MSQLRRQATAAALLLALFCAGCIGVTPLPKRVKTPQGPELKQVDLSFLKAGQTDRYEVMEKLASLDTRVRSPRYFVGRWSASTWGAWAFACGYISCAGGAGRLWGRSNLLIQFDEDGRVKGYEVFPDHELASHLAAPAANEPSIDFSQPVELMLPALPPAPPCGRIRLTQGWFEYREVCQKKHPRDFKIEAAKIVAVETPRVGVADAEMTTAVIHFSERVRAGAPLHRDRMTVLLNISDLMQLVRFVGQSKQP